MIERLQFREAAKPKRENAKARYHSVVANGLEDVHPSLCIRRRNQYVAEEPLEHVLYLELMDRGTV